MKYGPALLRALAVLDGDALVLHPGDRPYVVTAGGQVELTTRALTLRALRTLIAELLPSDWYATLHRTGAVQYDMPPSAENPRHRFSVVAARLEDDLWMEIRRQTDRRRPRHLREVELLEETDLTLPSEDELWPAKGAVAASW